MTLLAVLLAAIAQSGCMVGYDTQRAEVLDTASTELPMDGSAELDVQAELEQDTELLPDGDVEELDFAELEQDTELLPDGDVEELDFTELEDADIPGDEEEVDSFDPSYGRVVDGLLALYFFDERAGTVAYNRVPLFSELELRVAGNPDAALPWRSEGWGLSFDGERVEMSRVDLLSSRLRATSALTVEAWIRVDQSLSLSSRGRIVGYELSGSERNFSLAVLSGGAVNGRLRSTVSGLDWSATSISRDVPHHLVMTSGNGVAQLYLDGVAVGDAQVSGSFDNWGELDYRLCVGNLCSEDRIFYGEIGLVALYETALDAEAVRRNFEAGLPEFFVHDATLD